MSKEKKWRWPLTEMETSINQKEHVSQETYHKISTEWQVFGDRIHDWLSYSSFHIGGRTIGDNCICNPFCLLRSIICAEMKRWLKCYCYHHCVPLIFHTWNFRSPNNKWMLKSLLLFSKEVKSLVFWKRTISQYEKVYSQVKSQPCWSQR